MSMFQGTKALLCPLQNTFQKKRSCFAVCCLLPTLYNCPNFHIHPYKSYLSAGMLLWSDPRFSLHCHIGLWDSDKACFAPSVNFSINTRLGATKKESPDIVSARSQEKERARDRKCSRSYGLERADKGSDESSGSESSVSYSSEDSSDADEVEVEHRRRAISASSKEKH